LHHFCKHKDGNHKLELLDTGAISYQRMQQEITRVFDVDPSAMSITRIDLAADVPDVPVEWFQVHARAKWKQWLARFYSEMDRRSVQTLYFGKRPNCIRIYDKVSEYQNQFHQMCRRASDAAELPTFEEVFKLPETSVLTRVERQIGGCRLPRPIDTIKKMRYLPDFNPFDRLELLNGKARSKQTTGTPLKAALSTHPDRDSDERMKGFVINLLFKELGAQEARAFLNQQSKGNAARYIRTYRAFLPSDDAGLDDYELLRRYQESVSRQLAA
jgi:hypothetical protein